MIKGKASNCENHKSLEICIAFQWTGPVSDQPVRNLELIIFFSGKNEKCSECLEMQNKHLIYPPPLPHQDPMCVVLATICPAHTNNPGKCAAG